MTGNDSILRLPGKVLAGNPVRAEDHNRIIDALGILAKEIRSRTLCNSSDIGVTRTAGGTLAKLKRPGGGGKGAPYSYPFQTSFDQSAQVVTIVMGNVIRHKLCPDRTKVQPAIAYPTGTDWEIDEDGNARFDAKDFTPGTLYKAVAVIDASDEEIHIEIREDGEWEIPECQHVFVFADFTFSSDAGKLVLEGEVNQWWSSDMQVVFEQMGSEGCCEAGSSDDGSSDDDGSDGSNPPSGGDGGESSDDGGGGSDDGSSDDSSDDSSGDSECDCPVIIITPQLIAVGTTVYVDEDNYRSRDKCFPDGDPQPCEVSINIDTSNIPCPDGFGETPLLATLSVYFYPLIAGTGDTAHMSKGIPVKESHTSAWDLQISATACSRWKITAQIEFPVNVPERFRNFRCQTTETFEFPGMLNGFEYCSTCPDD